MRNNANELAFPATISWRDENPEVLTYEGGLTKREYFAGIAMQGMLANPAIVQNAKNAQTFCEELCLASVEQADELLKRLEQTKTDKPKTETPNP